MEDLLNHIKNYFNLKIKIIGLVAKEKTSKISAVCISTVLILLILIAFFFFASIGLALFISELIGYTYSGFVILAGFFLILLIVALVFKKALLYKPITNIFIRIMTKNND